MGNASASAATLSSAIGIATFPSAATLSSTICFWNLDGDVSGLVWCWNCNGLSRYWNGLPNMGYCLHHSWFTFRRISYYGSKFPTSIDVVTMRNRPSSI
ncbi:hypothetical protein U1Q18_030636 [Sarracenia purpurea var. burkii]